MCGIVGIVSDSEVKTDLFEALTVLQHRGQDAAGMALWDSEKGIKLHKGTGLVRDVFPEDYMRVLSGKMGIGHTRYPTAGSQGVSQAQPMYSGFVHGVSTVHNGNIINAREMRDFLVKDIHRDISSDSDSEIYLNLLVNELANEKYNQLQPDNIFNATERVIAKLKGSLTSIHMVNGHGILGIRDHMGVRPLCIGMKPQSGNSMVMLASESAALLAMGFTQIQDIKPGTMVWITKDGDVIQREIKADTPSTALPCIFEWVYMARPDSTIDGASVHKVRQRMGYYLAKKIQRLGLQDAFDIVIPVPESSTISTIVLARELNKVYSEGLVKNRYVGRTFIMPDDKSRQKGVRRKLTAVESEFKDKRILLVDDSIVRGTTSRQLVDMVRNIGVKKVYMASASPAIHHQNVFGIDMPSRRELIAPNRSLDEFADLLRVDGLIFQDLEDLKKAVIDCGCTYDEFETSIFDGRYPLSCIDEEYLTWLSRIRSDTVKNRNQLDIGFSSKARFITLG